MKPIDAVSELILKIHESAHQNTEWDSTLEMISDLGAIESIHLGSVETNLIRPKLMSMTRFPDNFNDLLDEFQSPSEDFAFQTVSAIPQGKLITPNDVFKDTDELKNTRMYRELLTRAERYPLYAVKLIQTRDHMFFLMGSHKEFSKEMEYNHKCLIEMLIPHIALALKTQMTLEIHNSSQLAFVESLNYHSFGVFFVDENSSVLFANRTAEHILKLSDGLYVRRGKLCAERQRDTALLESYILKAARLSNGDPDEHEGEGVMALPRPSFAKDFSVLVSPLVRRDHLRLGNYSPSVAVFVSDPEKTIPMSRTRVLEKLYNFTPTEAKVAIQMMKGHGMQFVADSLNLSLPTIKTHQRGIFQKLDVKNQAELVRHLTQSVAFLGHE